jgi:hypothetical protein
MSTSNSGPDYNSAAQWAHNYITNSTDPNKRDNSINIFWIVFVLLLLALALWWWWSSNHPVTPSIKPFTINNNAKSTTPTVNGP